MIRKAFILPLAAALLSLASHQPAVLPPPTVPTPRVASKVWRPAR